MSVKEPILSGKKAKRAKRDAERAEQHRQSKSKRRHVDTSDEQGQKEETGHADSEHVDQNQVSVQPSDRPSKKRKKTEEQAGFVVDTQGDAQLATSSEQPVKKRQKTEKAGEDTPEASGKKRFIVFIGNLPYSTTDESLDKHFAKLKPFTLRHRTDPKSKKSKGFAFIEFDNFDRMKTCLKLYHHSLFDPNDPGLGAADDQQQQLGESKRSASRRIKSKARKINVELTAGGGGGSEARKEKIKAKNVRLEEQRARRIEAEKKQKDRKKRKTDEAVDKKDVDEQSSKKSKPAHAVMGDIHPSRLAQVH